MMSGTDRYAVAASRLQAPAAALEPVRSASMTADAVPRRAVTPAHWDVIVIGSGMGGLATASLMAQLRGSRVLLLEQHYELGGFTHSFRRPGGYHWDVGLHYVGQMAPGDAPRGMMDLIAGGHVDWRKMPSPFERYIYPGLAIEQPDDRDAYIDTLSRTWPRERRGLVAYFEDVRRTARWIAPYLLSTQGSALVRWPARAVRWLGARRALRTTAAVLDEHIRDPELKAVLASQWGDYGLPPRQSAFVVHAIIVNHYLGGGWYPIGGAGQIAKGARRVIEAAGGACLTGHRVETLLIEQGRVRGVRAACTRGARAERVEFLAPVVVSDAGARATLEQLVPAAASSPRLERCAEDLRQLPEGYGTVQLFVGLSESPEALGLHGENLWMFDGLDHDAIYERRNDLADGAASMAYVSFPSLKNPLAHTHTAEIIAPLDHAVLGAWANRPWRRRGEAYGALKQTMSDALLGFVEQRLPGFQSRVACAELGTPLSVEHFAAHPGGATYGIPGVPQRYALDWLGVTTPVPGLLLTGSDACCHGIVGAMMGGVGAAAHLMGASGFPTIATAARRAGSG